MAPFDSNDSEITSVDWSTMSYLFDDDDDSVVFVPMLAKRKRVRISDAPPQILNLVRPLSEMSHEERTEGWWQKHEYDQTKATAKNKCRKLRAEGNGCHLTQAYQKASCVADSVSDLTSPISSHYLQPDKSLVEWCASAESPRGLERWSSKMHGYQRGKQAGEVKHAVFVEQAKQFLANQRDQDRIACVAREASKPARAFARMLGQADAAAVATKRKQRQQQEGPANKRQRHVSFGQE